MKNSFLFVVSFILCTLTLASCGDDKKDTNTDTDTDTPQELAGIGADCTQNADCQSNFCQKQADAEDTDKGKCAQPESDSKLKNGTKCSSDQACESGWCKAESDEADADKTCTAKLGEGAECTNAVNYCAEELSCEDDPKDNKKKICTNTQTHTSTDLEDNQPCEEDEECHSGWCKAESDAPGSTKKCSPKLGQNAECTNAVNYCEDELSCEDDPAQDGKKICTGDSPSSLKPNSESCNEDDECQSGWCKAESSEPGAAKQCAAEITKGAECVPEIDRCESELSCLDDPNNTGKKICTKVYIQNGDPCTIDDDCLSGWCKSLSNDTNGSKKCSPKLKKAEPCFNAEDYCENGLICMVNANLSDGLISVDIETFDYSMNIELSSALQCVDTSVLKEDGAECGPKDICKSGLCMSVNGEKAKCIVRAENGQSCIGSLYCRDGWCQADNLSAGVLGTCTASLDDGQPCRGGIACKSGWCKKHDPLLLDESEWKCTAQIPEGEICNVGICELPLTCRKDPHSPNNICRNFDLLGNGKACENDNECESDWCGLPDSGTTKVCLKRLSDDCTDNPDRCEHGKACVDSQPPDPPGTKNCMYQCDTDVQCNHGYYKGNKGQVKCDSTTKTCVLNYLKDPCENTTCNAGSCKYGVCVTQEMLNYPTDGTQTCPDGFRSFCSSGAMYYCDDTNHIRKVDCAEQGLTGCAIVQLKEGEVSGKAAGLHAMCVGQISQTSWCNQDQTMDLCGSDGEGEYIRKYLCKTDLRNSFVAIPVGEPVRCETDTPHCGYVWADDSFSEVRSYQALAICDASTNKFISN